MLINESFYSAIKHFFMKKNVSISAFSIIALLLFVVESIISQGIVIPAYNKKNKMIEEMSQLRGNYFDLLSTVSDALYDCNNKLLVTPRDYKHMKEKINNQLQKVDKNFYDLGESLSLNTYCTAYGILPIINKLSYSKHFCKNLISHSTVLNYNALDKQHRKINILVKKDSQKIESKVYGIIMNDKSNIIYNHKQCAYFYKKIG